MRGPRAAQGTEQPAAQGGELRGEGQVEVAGGSRQGDGDLITMRAGRGPLTQHAVGQQHRLVQVVVTSSVVGRRSCHAPAITGLQVCAGEGVEGPQRSSSSHASARPRRCGGGRARRIRPTGRG